jgi:cell wall assembly regulator SMI1
MRTYSQLAPSYKESVLQLIRYWRSQGVQINLGATEQELDAFENRFDLSLPVDFRFFYSVVNGMPGLDMDEYLFSLWPLQRIVTEEAVYKSVLDRNATEVTFGDFLIDSHRYLLVVDERGGSNVWVQWGEKRAIGFRISYRHT